MTGDEVRSGPAAPWGEIPGGKELYEREEMFKGFNKAEIKVASIPHATFTCNNLIPYLNPFHTWLSCSTGRNSQTEVFLGASCPEWAYKIREGSFHQWASD